MSIKQKKFDDEIKPLWDEIRHAVEEINSKGLSTDDVGEIAHLKKVIPYFSQMLGSIDPDFVPNKILNSNQLLNNIKNDLKNYKSNNQIHYIRNINSNYLDTLLFDWMPFVFYKGRAGQALQKALTGYSTTIQECTDSYVKKSQEAAENAEEYRLQAKKIIDSLDDQKERFDEYGKKLFDVDNNIKRQIENLVEEFEQKSEEIKQLHNQIFEGNNGLQTQFNGYYEQIKEKNTEIESLKNNSSKILDELKKFHGDIYGIENDDGELENGLKQEITKRQNELEEFKKLQQERYSELNEQIESLLPAATSAGLASAYKEMKDRCSRDIATYGWIFYSALGLLLVIVVLMHSLDFYNIPINDNNLSNNLTSVFRMFALKLPFILPVLWLAFFSSKCRSEALRLEQEYAHKETLAKSYDSYRQQVEKLGKEEQNKLLPILLDNMIKAIALNPAETLDKNHKTESIFDRFTSSGVLEKLSESISIKK